MSSFSLTVTPQFKKILFITNCVKSNKCHVFNVLQQTDILASAKKIHTSRKPFNTLLQAAISLRVTFRTAHFTNSSAGHIADLTDACMKKITNYVEHYREYNVFYDIQVKPLSHPVNSINFGIFSSSYLRQIRLKENFVLIYAKQFF